MAQVTLNKINILAIFTINESVNLRGGISLIFEGLGGNGQGIDEYSNLCR